MARGRGRQSPADAMQQQCVCVGWGGGHKAPKCSPHLPQPLSLLPYPSSQGSTRISWVSRVACSQPRGGDAAGVAAPGPAGLRLRSGSVPEGGRRVFFCCGISCWRGRGDYLLPAAFLCPRHKARRGHVRWKAPESRGGDGKKGRGASEASLLASAVNSCRGGGGGAGLFSETGVLGGGCVPWGLFFGVTLW